MAPATRDRWAEWLAERRFGGDPEVRAEVLARLTEVRDTVLDRAELRKGETLLDGCGEGLIGFGALERGAGSVIFSDISTDLLDFCREAAAELGVLDRCEFVEAAADDIGSIDAGSVDVVTTRSVLIYVKEKAEAFGEFARVLRSGGRISLWEPINRFGSRERREGGFVGYPVEGLDEVVAKLMAVVEAIQHPDTDPMLDFDERDLLRLAEEAGFSPLRLTLDARVEPPEPRSWDGFLDTAWNPNVPTLREAMNQALAPDERERLAMQLRSLVEWGEGERRMAFAHLSGVRA
ncbi:MAG TPA: class I SAM-dependent methyltransferase [Gaiellaceae bacterium]|nr:class I SAM-dependent methyltransferase [Gaiellaceae bacterium]